MKHTFCEDLRSRVIDIIEDCAEGLAHIDTERVSAIAADGAALSGEVEQGLDAATRTAASLIESEPAFSQLAARLLRRSIDLEIAASGVRSFADFVRLATDLDLLNETTEQLLTHNMARFAARLTRSVEWPTEYFGLRTLSDRYLLRHPTTRRLIEGPDHFLIRVSAGLSDDVEQALELQALIASGAYISSNLFNAGTRHQQLCSCFLIDSPEDSIHGIYDCLKDVALISKFSGGVGQAYHSVRSRGSTVSTTNGVTRGIVPWLKIVDSSVAAVDQGGRRNGAACIYLESWHADIEQFLALRDNTGPAESRTYHLQLGNWIPDLFMRRVEADEDWSLFDPKDVPQLRDLWGDRFDAAYLLAEKLGKAKAVVRARDLYARMLRTLGETGNGWMTFKDTSNRTCNQTAHPSNVVHLSNLCTEILQVTSSSEIAVCTLGSINLSRHLKGAAIDYEALAKTTSIAVRQLDRVIDRTYYPLERARDSNVRWRPIGLGVMGLQDVLFRLRLPFDSDSARKISTDFAECIYFNALATSCDLAREKGHHPAFDQTRTAQGYLHFDLWGKHPCERFDWAGLRARIRQHGLRNSLLVAIAPTATIAAITGCYESIEPQFANLFRKETASGEFVQINRYLVEDLRKLGLWNERTREAIKAANGSVQSIRGIPAEMRILYRTVWELPQKALIDLAAARGPFVDQSQSLNLYLENPSLDALASMYMYAWKSGLKTTYYLRSRAATRISQSAGAGVETTRPAMCATDSGEACEACQ